jgi:ubiquinone/menaquinone biosynthesis C-methylase UbiE
MSPATEQPVATPREPAHDALTRAWGRAFAWFYEPLMQATEKGGNADRRRALLAGATGTVVELGAGTGLNLPHYQPHVELVLTEPEAPMVRRLHDRVVAEGRAARVLQAPAEDLPLPDGCADTVVATLVLCTVNDVRAALAEARRVLRPGGRLLFIEHVAAPEGTRLRRWQDRLQRPWRRLAHGCATNRDTETALRNAGFTIDSIERGDMEAELLLRPLIWGAARPVAA